VASAVVVLIIGFLYSHASKKTRLAIDLHKDKLQFAHQPDGLGDQERISAGNQSSPTRASTSGRSPGV